MATGAIGDEKWVLDKLDGSSWATWKFQMRHLLLAKGLWGIIDGTEVLADDASPQVQAEFEKKSPRAFLTIVLVICTSQIYLVTSCEKPREAWGALRNHFERDTNANKLFLKKQYFRAEMSDGTSIEGNLKRMKVLTDKLAAIGAPISEENQVVTLLGSLPPGYATLVAAVESRVEDISLNYVSKHSCMRSRSRREQQMTHREEIPLCWDKGDPGNLHVSAVANQVTFDEIVPTS